MTTALAEAVELGSIREKQGVGLKRHDHKVAVVPAFDKELLRIYYSRLFPFSLLYSWLSYGRKSSLFSRREFSFTIEPTPGDEIYIRYQSFATQNDLARAVCAQCPIKIDIGAVFSAPPKDKQTLQKGSFAPVERELVFDIDLTDYDQVRQCGCTGASICKVCWGFMKMAVKVMDTGIRDDFGFKRIAWFYSGRRGVHAWVADDEARKLSDEARSAVAEYFNIYLGTEKNKEVNLKVPLHPMLSRAFGILEPLFIEQVLPESGHGLLAKRHLWEELLDSLPDEAELVQKRLAARWAEDNSTPAARWAELKQHLNEFRKAAAKAGVAKAPKRDSSESRDRLESWQFEVVFRYTYPRLDISVSKTRNHLLKSPFCVHPKTGRVCVPIDPKHVDDFDPFKVPTLSQVIGELDQASVMEEKAPDQLDWKKTSLKDYFMIFEKDFLEPLSSGIRGQERDAAEQQAALVGDF